MSKKDFIALADDLRSGPGTWSMTEEEKRGFDIAVGCVANACKRINPNFKRERWLDYIEGKCGPSGGRVGHSTVKKEPDTGPEPDSSSLTRW